ncbi:MAG: 23S rRNA methyltransferase [Alteromonadaceae bacterium]|nr:MAG: 23S rRNA methyltransferase [Alteromonadaceae bacterium]
MAREFKAPSAPAGETISSLFDAEVKGLASDGRGVLVHPSGKTFFAEGVWPGERGQFRVTGHKSSVGFADLVELYDSSPDRIDAPCPHYGLGAGKCGGCTWMFASYEAQLQAKQQRVEQSFARIDVNDIAEIWPAPQPLGYRNRAEFKTDGKAIGFVASFSHQLVPIEDCLVLTEPNRATLKSLLTMLPNEAWSKLPSKRSRKTGKKRRQDWTVLGIDEQVEADQVIPNLRRPFAQANQAQNLRMQAWLRDGLQAVREKNAEFTLVDLFCGSGNFTQVISDSGFGKVLGVEAVEEALSALNERELPGVKTFACDIFSEGAFSRIFSRDRGADCRVLVLDPPRDGLKDVEVLLKQAKKLQEVFYISCDLATLVRDVKQFQQYRFEVLEVQPLDQFAQTAHVEMMVHLRRRRK